MKIVVTPLPSGSAVTLGDDSVGDYIIDPPPLPAEKRGAQRDELAFADRAFGKGIGNRETSFAWTVSREHADQVTADGFVWGHAPAVPIDCSIQITDSAGTWNFSSAVIEEVTLVEWSGKSTKFRYSVGSAVPA